MTKQFHITVSFDNKILVDCNSDCAAFISDNNAATLCLTNDIVLRIVLAARTKVYLNSLINAIVTDSDASRKDIEGLIDEIVKDIKIEEERVEPFSKDVKFEAILEQVKRARRAEGNGEV